MYFCTYFPHLFVFSDIDECADGQSNCDDTVRASCINLPGTYNCTCNSPYSGVGTLGTCIGKFCKSKTVVRYI